jgi:zinc protease
VLYPGGHPYGRDVMGIDSPRGRSDLRAVDAEALRAFHHERYAPEACVLAIAGDLDLDRTEAWVRSHYGAIPARPAASRGADPAPPLSGERRAWLPAEVGRASLLMAWRGVPVGHPDEPALAVLAWLLSHGAFAEGLAARREVEIEAWNDAWQLGGGFVVSLRGEGQALEPLGRAVDAELARLALRGPEPAALERARGAWVNRWLRAADPVQGRASLMAQCLARELPADCAADELQRYQVVVVEDIQRVAQGLLDAPGRVLLTVASEADYELGLPGSEPMVLP